MAGHGRPISPEEVNRTERSVLPISLTSRLQTNTWRQVFTSLRPLVAQTRQRTLSTYARRLHQRQHDVQFRRPQLEGEEQQSLLYPHPPDLHGETNRGARGTDNMNNVIIDIEDGNSYVSHSQNIPDIPVPPQLLHTEPHNSNLPTDNIHGSVSASSTVEGSGSSFTTSSTSEPLLPMSGTTASVDEGGNAAETAHNDATGASTNRSEGESLTELLSQFPEVRSGLLVAWHYCIFFSIILAKALVLLIPPDHEGYGVMDLMWIVIVSDYVLKLVTVLGKYFLVVEMGSQLYRSLAPIQPWLSYLLDGYAGPRKVLGIFLSATYMVCKGPDIVTKMKCFQAAIVKFINSVNYGCTPSKSQLEDAGGLCPICHDDFLLPTMLRCKHIFCEQCVVTWFDRERTCPMCRTQVADDPAWRDGSTSHFLQVY
ncbi:RING finger and transmembrane domain-containing protein 2-like [Homarus americanus]|uniref:RING finger and transmembrane domain-containing protein 2-like n=1 Tax=Homarus americanus TaxID=6706 RepID=A0A8J5JUB1_HOMAM|nr:RING finger and transmembrane domain-containing protein 2-like [Homarus americanus]